jgi:arylsulfatase A-like enzyme
VLVAACAGATFAAPAPLGVILVSLDTLRGRSTSGGGTIRDTTPHLAREMGGDGVVFDNAITTAPHTLPAHVSMLTGRYLRSHGVRSLTAHIAADAPTLTQVLKTAGFETAAFTEDGFVVPEVGIARGFDVYQENKSANLHEPVGFADAIFASGLDWLAAHRDRPFFLFLHTYQVHSPYVPPPPYDEWFEPERLIPYPAAKTLLRYEQEARYLDDLLGHFLDGLDALGLRERTLLVVTADHGEEFGEHGQFSHGYQLYDEAVRVPLVMRLPGALPAGRRVMETAVSLADVTPTIVDLLGLPPISGADGTSLVPLLIDGAGPFPREHVFAETISSMLAPEPDVVSYREGPLSCIVRVSEARTECFDRTGDPDEKRPLPDDDPRLLRARDAVAVFTGRGAAADDAAPAADGGDPERLEKLKALGYGGK